VQVRVGAGRERMRNRLVRAPTVPPRTEAVELLLDTQMDKRQLPDRPIASTLVATGRTTASRSGHMPAAFSSNG